MNRKSSSLRSSSQTQGNNKNIRSLKTTRENLKVPHRRCSRQARTPHGAVMRSESRYRCLRASGRLPGGGSIMQAAQPSLVLTCTACSWQQVPCRSLDQGPCLTFRPLLAAEFGNLRHIVRISGDTGQEGGASGQLGVETQRGWGNGSERLIFLMMKVLPDTVCGALTCTRC